MAWLEEDPELLNAALFLLAGEPIFACAEASLQPVSSPSAVSETGTKRRRMCVSEGGKSINASRERQRKELKSLRAQAEYMESLLTSLQLRREQQLRPFIGANGQAQSVVVYWEAIAKRQFLARKQSEMLNAKLQAMRESQLRVTDSLLSAICRAEDDSRRINAEGGVSESKHKLAIDVSQRVSEEDQLRRLEWLYKMSDSVFEDSPCFSSAASLDFFDIRSTTEENGYDLVMDVESSGALPYSVAHVQDALWRLILTERVEEEGETWTQDHTCTADNNIIGLFEALTTLSGQRSKFSGKFVCKRGVDKHGHMVIAMNNFCFVSQTSSHEDCEFEEDTWVRVVDAQKITGRELDSPLTVIQCVRRTRVTFVGLRHCMEATCDGLEQVDHRKTLVEFFQQQAADELEQEHRAIENMLLATTISV